MSEAQTFLQKGLETKEARKIIGYFRNYRIGEKETVLAAAGSTILFTYNGLVVLDGRIVYMNFLKLKQPRSILFSELEAFETEPSDKTLRLFLKLKNGERCDTGLKFRKAELDRLLSFLENRVFSAGGKTGCLQTEGSGPGDIWEEAKKVNREKADFEVLAKEFAGRPNIEVKLVYCGGSIEEAKGLQHKICVSRSEQAIAILPPFASGTVIPFSEFRNASLRDADGALTEPEAAFERFGRDEKELFYLDIAYGFQGAEASVTYSNKKSFDGEENDLFFLAYLFLNLAGKAEAELSEPAPEEIKKTELSASAAAVAEELREYKKLMDEGILTSEEFEAKKKQLLNL